MLATVLARNGKPRPQQLVLLGEFSTGFPFPIDATLPKPVRPARLRAQLHHLLIEREDVALIS
jgi:hypothetical protein